MTGPDLDRTHVFVGGRRQDCVVFEYSGEKYFCCISESLTNALKEELRKRRKEKGKRKRRMFGF